MTEAARRPSTRRPNEGGVIEAVRPGSLADESGLRPGDRVTAIDGRVLRDAVDFQFFAAEELIEVDVVRDGARPFRIEIEKHPDEDLGIDFQDAAFDGVRTCNNTCFFCFLKGNPKGMRKTLYVKDDDYRLSFFHGNFVTLTNLNDEDWGRLEEQRLSPINVSVHATEPQLRRYLLGNANAPDIVEQLRQLGDIGITANTQVVLCPGVNDGAALDRTIRDLAALHPAVETISIVPVGATMTAEERIVRGEHGAEIDSCNPEYASSVIEQVEPYQRRFRREFGRTLVYLADEFYLAAAARIPSNAHYDGFPQYENGIGMTRSLLEDWRRARRAVERRRAPRRGTSKALGSQGLARREAASVVGDVGDATIRSISAVCGKLIAPVLESIFQEFTAATRIAANVVAVENTFFGPRVNVSGLLTAQDILRTLDERALGDLVVLPRYTLDYTGSRFLDDVTPNELQSSIGRPLAFASTMSEVLQILAEPLESDVAGAETGAATNGKSWVDYAAKEVTRA